MKLVLFFVRLELMMSKGVFDEKREVRLRRDALRSDQRA
jgi:hypothetical protein